jgi:hypothetical protein
MEKDANNRRPERGMEIFSECLAAMLYSDDEIRAGMTSEDAEEFIEMRNDLIYSSRGTVASDSYVENDISLPLAAEEEATY